MIPTPATASDYLESAKITASSVDIASAFHAEKAAQAKRCRVPVEGEWPADLVEALHRRIAVLLTLRKKPLGLESSVTELGPSHVKVGGGDREVTRLEAPYRRVVIG